MPGMSPNARTSAAYWKRRTELEEARAYRTAEQAAKEMRRYYRAQYLRTAKQMENLYAEVQRQGTLSRTKLWQYRQWREMEADLAKFCDAGAMIERDRIRQCLDKVFQDVIEKPVEFFDPSQYVIRMSPEAVINTAWSGENYSERVWKNRTELAEHLRMDMEEMIGQGTSIKEITRRVQKDFNVSYGRAEALVKTEASYVFNQATLARYEASGIEKVRYITERDSRVCESCAGYDNMVFYMADAPRLPLHPRCRCRYAPVIERPGEEVPVDGELQEGGVTAAETLANTAPEEIAAQALPNGTEKIIPSDSEIWQEIGDINPEYLGGEFGTLNTTKTVITYERSDHIRDHHPQDYALFMEYGNKTISEPDIVIKDSKNEDTVFMVTRLEGTNVNAVVKLSVVGHSDQRNLNTVLTFFRMRNRNIEKLMKKNKVLYEQTGL